MSGLLIAAGNTTTNPDPNGLSTPNPYGDPYINRFTPSAAWLAQAAGGKSDALVTSGSNQIGHPTMGRIKFKPSNGSATYIIGVWVWDDTADYWFLATLLENNRLPFSSGGSVGYAGYGFSGTVPTNDHTYSDVIIDPPLSALFIEIKALSTGTLAIYYDSGVFDLLGASQPI